MTYFSKKFSVTALSFKNILSVCLPSTFSLRSVFYVHYRWLSVYFKKSFSFQQEVTFDPLCRYFVIGDTATKRVRWRSACLHLHLSVCRYSPSRARRNFGFRLARTMVKSWYSLPRQEVEKSRGITSRVTGSWVKTWETERRWGGGVQWRYYVGRENPVTFADKGNTCTSARPWTKWRACARSVSASAPNPLTPMHWKLPGLFSRQRFFGTNKTGRVHLISVFSFFLQRERAMRRPRFEDQIDLNNNYLFLLSLLILIRNKMQRKFNFCIFLS